MTDETTTTSRTPEEIRADIEETRAELGDTAAALAEKADVKAQAKAKVDEKKDELKARVTGAKDAAAARAGGAKESVSSASPQQAQQAAAHVAASAREQPLPFATAGAFAGGLLLGWLLGRRS